MSKRASLYPRRPRTWPLPAASALSVLAALPAASPGQWAVEEVPLVAGWNAVWLSVDATGHLPPPDAENAAPVEAVLDAAGAVGAAVEEVWAWNANASPARFVQSPSAPVQPDVQWLVWRRGDGAQSTLASLPANTAYLFKVADGAAPASLTLKGRPVPPSYAWTSSGLNFFGFPVREPASAADRNFDRFLSFSTDLSTSPDIFRYVGGPLGEGTNPVRVTAPRNTAVLRNRAYWIRSSQFSTYYGPLRVSVARAGLAFGDVGSVVAIKLGNVTGTEVVATLTPLASAAAPGGQPVVAGPVPLRLRGGLDPATGAFSYTDLAGPEEVTLAAGEEAELVFAVDRPAMGGAAGDVFQSLLRVNDSHSVGQVDLPVSAVTTSRSGLWVGAAVVDAVDQVTAAPEPQADGTATVAVSTEADASAPSSYPVRLIFHRDAAGTVRLLQRVYHGPGAGGETVLASAESALDAARLAEARRISSATFPPGAALPGTGDLGLTGDLTFLKADNQAVVLSHASPTNPFLHIYHPEHDNRDAQFAPLPTVPAADADDEPSTAESSTVSRDLTFSFAADPAALGLPGLGWGSTVLGGTYAETIRGLRAQPVKVRGAFVIRRVSEIPELVVAP